VEVVLNLEYEISEQDFVDAQNLAIKNAPVRFIRWTRLVLPVFGAVFLAFLVRTVFQQGFSWRVLPAAIVPLIFISTPLLNRWNQSKMYAKTTSLHSRLSLAAENDMLRFQGPTFSSDIRWPHFYRFVEDERSFLLYQNAQAFNIVPKRGLSPDQIKEFRALLKQNISPQQ